MTTHTTEGYEPEIATIDGTFFTADSTVITDVQSGRPEPGVLLEIDGGGPHYVFDVENAIDLAHQLLTAALTARARAERWDGTPT